MKAARHPLGPALRPERRCGACHWSRMAGPGPKVLRCLASGSRRVEADWAACEVFESEPDCLDCAACCGPAYHAVEISRRDPVRRKHPDVVVVVEGRPQIRRTADNHCSCLLADNRCRIYPDRPRCCRDFEKGSANCLDARRRSDLSPRWPS